MLKMRLTQIKAKVCEYSFRAKEIINRRILPQQTSQTYMYSSFVKRELQYDPFRAKEIINPGILQQQTIFHYRNSFNG